MYTQVSAVTNLPVISLQTGDVVAWTCKPVLEIETLAIIAFLCTAADTKRSLILMSSDIRQIADDCAIVDSAEELTDPSDIIRLQPALLADYTPLDKLVVSDTGRRLGRVHDYTINLETTRIQKLLVRGSLLNIWFGPKLTVDRTQIIDITPTRITVRDVTIKAPVLAPKALPKTSS